MSFISITSTQNPAVKQWAGLLTKKGRDEQQRYLIEGAHLVQEALRAGYPIETIIFSEERGIPNEIKAYEGKQAEWISVSEAVLKKCTDARTPQAVCAVVRRMPMSWNALIEKQQALVVLVDGVQDPGNLGTIIRSADAAGADGVLIGKGTVDLYNPKTLRSTMGSLFHLPVVECDLIEVLQQVRQQPSIQIVNTSLQAEHSCYASDFRESTWFIFGNEGQGVSAEVAAYVNHAVKIPMEGKAESLNVAMAATILLFEALRQRKHL